MQGALITLIADSHISHSISPVHIHIDSNTSFNKSLSRDADTVRNFVICYDSSNILEYVTLEIGTISIKFDGDYLKAISNQILIDNNKTYIPLPFIFDYLNNELPLLCFQYTNIKLIGKLIKPSKIDIYYNNIFYQTEQRQFIHNVQNLSIEKIVTQKIRIYYPDIYTRYDTRLQIKPYLSKKLCRDTFNYLLKFLDNDKTYDITETINLNCEGLCIGLILTITDSIFQDTEYCSYINSVSLYLNNYIYLDVNREQMQILFPFQWNRKLAKNSYLIQFGNLERKSGIQFNRLDNVQLKLNMTIKYPKYDFLKLNIHMITIPTIKIHYGLCGLYY